MIFFLLNNNYHRYDLERNRANFNDSNIVVIEIPHTLDHKSDIFFANTLRFESKSQNGLLRHVFNYFLISQDIKRKLELSSNDVLFIYTEFELLNQLVVRLFNAVGARVYLIEDGGMGSYVPFRSIDSEPLALKEVVKKIIYRSMPGLGKLRFRKLNGIIFRWLPDSCFDGFCEYEPITHRRAIPTILIKRPNALTSQASVKGRVVFLNECIYNYYQSEEQYFSGLNWIIKSLSSTFGEVYFKYHPRESVEWRRKIKRRVLDQYPTVKVIDENAAFEEMVEEYQPAVLASYFASALLGLVERGVEPLYLYHLIPELAQQPVFKEVTSILNEMGYQFVSDFQSLESHYRSGLVNRQYENAMTLADLVNSYKK